MESFRDQPLSARGNVSNLILPLFLFDYVDPRLQESHSYSIIMIRLR